MPEKIFERKSGKFVFTLLATLLATTATYILNNHLSLGPVIAASLIGLVSAVVWKEYRTALYAGALAGMTSSMVTSMWWAIAFIGIMTGVILRLLDVSPFRKMGGKLGTAAFLSVAAAGLLASRDILKLVYTGNSFPHLQPWFIILFLGALGSILTYLFSIRLTRGFHWRNNIYFPHPQVFASAATGLIGVLIAAAVWPENVSSGSLIMYTGSFVGMCTSEAFFKKPIFTFMLGGLVSAAIFVLGQDYFVGFGGKIGFIAFLTVFVTEALLRIFSGITAVAVIKRKGI